MSSRRSGLWLSLSSRTSGDLVLLNELMEDLGPSSRSSIHAAATRQARPIDVERRPGERWPGGQGKAGSDNARSWPLSKGPIETGQKSRSLVDPWEIFE